MSTLDNSRCSGYPEAVLNRVGSWLTYPPCFGSVERFDLQHNFGANVPADRAAYKSWWVVIYCCLPLGELVGEWVYGRIITSIPSLAILAQAVGWGYSSAHPQPPSRRTRLQNEYGTYFRISFSSRTRLQNEHGTYFRISFSSRTLLQNEYGTYFRISFSS